MIASMCRTGFVLPQAFVGHVVHMNDTVEHCDPVNHQLPSLKARIVLTLPIADGQAVVCQTAVPPGVEWLTPTRPRSVRSTHSQFLPA